MSLAIYINTLAHTVSVDEIMVKSAYHPDEVGAVTPYRNQHPLVLCDSQRDCWTFQSRYYETVGHSRVSPLLHQAGGHSRLLHQNDNYISLFQNNKSLWKLIFSSSLLYIQGRGQVFDIGEAKNLNIFRERGFLKTFLISTFAFV